jgi:hypothetical protein
MNASVHLPFFWHETNSTEPTRVGNKRATYVVRVVNEYLNHWRVAQLDLFIYTNSTKALAIQSEFQRVPNVKIHFILHTLEGEHPFNLTWKCRQIMEKQVKEDFYDIYMYIEDDIGVPFAAVEYWLTYKDILHSANLDVGFVRVETNQPTFFGSTDDFTSTDVLIPCGSQPIKTGDRWFMWNHQNYCAFWICDRKEMRRFVASEYWPYHGFFPEGPGKPPQPFIQESSAIGFKMSYRGSFYPFEGEPGTAAFRVWPACFVHHLPNNFINHPAHEQGKFAIKRMNPFQQ